MAVERQKIISYTLQQFVSNQAEAFAKSRQRIRDLQESEFQRRVFENGLSYTDQQQYYENLLKEEQGKSITDSKYQDAIKTKITSIKSLVEAENFANLYRASFERLKTEQGNINEHIDFLNTQLGATKNNELRTKIQDLISEANQSRNTIQNNALMNRIRFAQADKRPEILQNALNEVQGKYNQSLAIGDEESATAWNLHIQALTSQLRNVQIEQKINEFEVKGMNGQHDAVSTFKYLESMFKGAIGNTPINIGGKVYNSEKDFWNEKINGYLRDSFFNILQEEVANNIDVNAKKLTPVLESKFDADIVRLEALRNNEFIKPYLDKLDNTLTNVSAYGVEKIGEKVVSDYKNGLLGKTTSENINNALEKLTNLNKWYNVDVKSAVDAIVNDVAGTKSTIIQNQVSQYQNAIKEGYTPAEAWKFAESSVAQIDIPNIDVATGKPIDIAKETVSSMTQPSKYDITKTEVKTPTPQVSQPTFKPESTPQIPTPTIQRGEYIPNPELLSLLKPEQIVDEGGKKYLASGVTAPYRKITSPDELKNYTESQLIRPKGSNDIYLKI